MFILQKQIGIYLLTFHSSRNNLESHRDTPSLFYLVSWTRARRHVISSDARGVSPQISRDWLPRTASTEPRRRYGMAADVSSIFACCRSRSYRDTCTSVAFVNVYSVCSKTDTHYRTRTIITLRNRIYSKWQSTRIYLFIIMYTHTLLPASLLWRFIRPSGVWGSSVTSTHFRLKSSPKCMSSEQPPHCQARGLRCLTRLSQPHSFNSPRAQARVTANATLAAETAYKYAVSLLPVKWHGMINIY